MYEKRNKILLVLRNEETFSVQQALVSITRIAGHYLGIEKHFGIITRSSQLLPVSPVNHVRVSPSRYGYFGK